MYVNMVITEFVAASVRCKFGTTKIEAGGNLYKMGYCKVLKLYAFIVF